MPVTINGSTGVTSPGFDSSGNLVMTGTGLRITGDFSNATVTNRVMFQTSTVNGATVVGFVSNGTSTDTAISVYNASSAANSSSGTLYANAVEVRLAADKLGTGTYLPMTFYTGGSERMRIDASGNVGIGTSSPAYPLDVNGNAQIRSTNSIYFFSSNYGIRASTGLELKTADVIRFLNGTTENARIDSSGNLLVGTTSQLSTEKVSINQTTAGLQALYTKNVSGDFNFNCWSASSTGNNQFIQFITETSPTARGSITYNRAAGLVAYNQTSDYRAKDINGPVQNALAIVAQLKPYMGVMKGATIERPMFIAHEAQAIAPYSVTGEKDAVDKKGDPVLQQIDHSTLVPLLTAAIQEQQQMIEELKAKVAAQAVEIAALKGAQA